MTVSSSGGYAASRALLGEKCPKPFMMVSKAIRSSFANTFGTSASRKMRIVNEAVSASWLLELLSHLRYSAELMS